MTALCKAPPENKILWGQNMYKGIQKHSFPTAYMMSIMHPLMTSRLIEWAFVRDNFGKNVHEFVVLIFVSYIHNI